VLCFNVVVVFICCACFLSQLKQVTVRVMFPFDPELLVSVGFDSW